MRTKVWDCHLDHQLRIVAKDPAAARSELLRQLFEHPETAHIEVSYVQDVVVTDKKEE